MFGRRGATVPFMRLAYSVFHARWKYVSGALSICRCNVASCSLRQINCRQLPPARAATSNVGGFGLRWWGEIWYRVFDRSNERSRHSGANGWRTSALRRYTAIQRSRRVQVCRYSQLHVQYDCNHTHLKNNTKHGAFSRHIFMNQSVLHFKVYRFS